ncbi:hypothetical protein PIB30_012421 [Stylosanthes scabra]|uniref:Gnk2-homologous domain-containing protein n=1 Tax=Stylosanthes scabra TaxID=79078 RepID=A0ABU6S6P3_9FABA|nr:hypothetical protein [Stylosanthes scabra]
MSNNASNFAASTTISLVLCLLLLWSSSVCECVPNTNITSVLCNSGVYTSGDPFAISLSYVLEDLEEVTPTQETYDYYNISPYPNAFAYGHAACNNNMEKKKKNLTSSDCKACLGVAKATILSSCEKRIGARSVLHDCTIRNQFE